jgi:hypothetical protein
MYTDGTPNSPTSSELPNGEESGGDSLNTEERGGDGKGKEREDKSKEASTGEKGKITAVVNVPQSKYEYNAIETPIIETPQLRDMGEATPPLEWIGLHRERLPNLTHQVYFPIFSIVLFETRFSRFTKLFFSTIRLLSFRF